MSEAESTPKHELERDLSPEERAALGDLSPVYERLRAHQVGEPDTGALMARLSVEYRARRAESRRHGMRDWLRLAWTQTQLMETPFWASSLLLTVIGLVLGLGNGSGLTALLLLFLSPVFAVTGVAYFFRPATRTLWELELLSHYHPFHLLYARLAVILAWNFGLAAILLTVAWTQGLQIILWRLLLIWFGPMIGVMGVALFCTVRWNTTAGIVMPALAWGGMVVIGWREAILLTDWGLMALSGGQGPVAQLAASNGVLVAAAAALVGGVALMVESGRQAARWR